MALLTENFVRLDIPNQIEALVQPTHKNVKEADKSTSTDVLTSKMKKGDQPNVNLPKQNLLNFALMGQAMLLLRESSVAKMLLRKFMARNTEQAPVTKKVMPQKLLEKHTEENSLPEKLLTRKVKAKGKVENSLPEKLLPRKMNVTENLLPEKLLTRKVK